MDLRLSAFLLLILFLFPAPASAGPVEDGKAALKRGDYEAGIKLIQPLADKGDVEAERMVGAAYWGGWGVDKDYAASYFWLSLVKKSTGGVMPGWNNPDELVLKSAAGHLTPAQIAAADKKVAAWKPAPAPAH
jgi:hypothetical protein